MPRPFLRAPKRSSIASKTKKNRRAGVSHRRLRCESLENRRLLSVSIPVVNTADSGTGSFRQAILDANAITSDVVIEFKIPATDPNFVDVDQSLTGGDPSPDVFVIKPQSGLPWISNGRNYAIVIDGRTQGTFGGNTNAFGPEIVIDGSIAGGTAGLIIATNNNKLLGLNVRNFTWAGIRINGSGNHVAGCFLGTDSTGTTAAGNNVGVVIGPGAKSNIIGTNGDGVGDENEGNVISGNRSGGVGINDAGNIVAGNLIGTDAMGTFAIGNGWNGVEISSGAGNRIGTDGNGSSDAIEKNVISGNVGNGVYIAGSGSVVAGNLVGTNLRGDKAIPNGSVWGGSGVGIAGGAAANRIGTDGNGLADDAERNVISGNRNDGVSISGTGSNGNIIAGNYVGTGVSGTNAIPNGGSGVVVSNGARSNRIGTDGNGIGDEAERNVISGNKGTGVDILGSGTDQNVVAGNFIGTDVAGRIALGNAQHGVRIWQGAKSNLVGTHGDGQYDAAERNVLSGNGWDGVALWYAGTQSNVVAGNFIGTDAGGSVAIPNKSYGVEINGGAAFNRIGTNGDNVADAAERNVIAGNQSNGVYVSASGTDGNIIAGNYVGTGVSGTNPLPNGGEGIYISSGATNNRVGTDGNGAGDAAERNIISANAVRGIYVYGASGNIVAGNYVGIDFTGQGRLGNGSGGIVVAGGSQSNRIGTNGDGVSDAIERNVASANTYNGIALLDAGTSGNTVAGNYVGTDAGGTLALGNGGAGIGVFNGASANRIGTDGNGIEDEAERNILSANAGDGVGISGAGTENNIIAGNFIGTDLSGTLALGNGYSGIGIGDGVRSNRFGTNGDGVADEKERNIISGNRTYGIQLWGTGSGANIFAGNYIGVDVSGSRALGNANDGLWLGAAGGNRVGTDGNGVGDAAEGNVISGNGANGIFLGSSSNVVAGNLIGTDATGSTALGNGQAGSGNGINIGSGAQLNRIGTDGNGTADEKERNIVSGNRGNGMGFWGAGATGNIVAGNYVGTDVTGTRVLGNAGHGLWIAGDGGYRIGTDGNGIADAAERNVISGNDANGIDVYGGRSNVIAGNYIGTDATGSIALGNGQAGSGNGVNIGNGAQFNRIGTDGNGTADTAERNIISGNSHDGIGFWGSGTSGNIVAGNYIGTDVTGLRAMSNAAEGLWIGGDGANRIGTDGNGMADTAERNVISANGSSGIGIHGSRSNIVAGNFIGVDATGGVALGNGFGVPWGRGVAIELGADDNIIGTNGDGQNDLAERNVISANSTSGIVVQSDAEGNVIAGNFIGTDWLGTAAIGNGGGGILIQNWETDWQRGARNTRVGTNADGLADEFERNVISGNVGFGILMQGNGTENNSVAGNSIGTDWSRTRSLGNLGDGIVIANGASLNRIGTDGDDVLDATEANVISGNHGNGVVVVGSSAIRNSIRGNSIEGNTGLGIDLGGDGVTANDPGDVDSGPNNLQNFPVLSTVLTGDATIVHGTIDSSPDTEYALDFYASSSLPRGQLGEAGRVLFSLQVVTDASGHAEFTEQRGAIVGVGEAVTATATDTYGSTSEISPPVLTKSAVYVLDVAPHDVLSGTVDHVEVTFNTQVDLDSLFDAVELIGPTGPVWINEFRWLHDTTYGFYFGKLPADGEYSLILGPNILDTAGNNAMDQNLNGEPGEEDDFYWATLSADVFGPRVTAVGLQGVGIVDAKGYFVGELYSLLVTFNEPIADGSVSTSDIWVQRADGTPLPPDIVQSVDRVSDTEYQVQLTPQTRLGEYRVTILPANIADAVGNLMDQNGDGSPDPYFGTFRIAEATARVVAQRPEGTLRTPVNALQVDFSRPMRPVSLLTSAITSTGPRGPIPVSSSSWLDADTLVLMIPPQSVSGSYSFTIAPWGVSDDRGRPLDQDGNGQPGEAVADAYRISFTIDATGPRVVEMVPSGNVRGTIGQLELLFSEGIAPQSISTQSITIETPSGGTVSGSDILVVTAVTDSRYSVSFSPQSSLGQYAVRVQPTVKDFVGNPLDQDRNGVGGEPGDIYTGYFTLAQYDLRAKNVTTGSSQLRAGEPLNVSWECANVRADDVLGDWTDSVYLSMDAQWDGSDVLLGTATHTGGLLSGTSYKKSLDVNVPGIAPGSYRVLVRVNEEGFRQEEDQGNNVAASASAIQLGYRVLTAIAPQTGVLSASDSMDFYAISVSTADTGRQLRIGLDGWDKEAQNELYVKRGAPPTVASNDLTARLSKADQELTIPSVTAGTYYVMVRGVVMSDSDGYSIEASYLGGRELSSVLPAKGGNAGNVTVQLAGSGFLSMQRVALVSATAGEIYARDARGISDAQGWATFDLRNRAPGVYDVRVTGVDGSIATLRQAFTVVPGSFVAPESNLGLRWGLPSTVHLGQPVTGSVELTNDGLQDVAVSRIRITLPDGRMTDTPVSMSGFPQRLVPPGGRLSVSVQYIHQGGPTNAVFWADAIDLSGRSIVSRSESVQICGSFDPNDKVGSAGEGEANFVREDEALVYVVHFENDPQVANAPAQTVRITDVMDDDLDLSTLELAEIAFANHVLQVPPGHANFADTVDLRAEGIDALVRVTATLDVQGRELTVTYEAIDPDTGETPENPLVGLLYPNDETRRGEGYVSYQVRPKADATTGSLVPNQARIYFDQNDPIDTPLVLNTIDAGAPTSRIEPLSAWTEMPEFLVAWSGGDDADGSGIASYDIYVSRDGGEYVPWIAETSETQAVFAGEIGHTYAFFSVAEDRVGHAEQPPFEADAAIVVTYPLAIEAGLDQTGIAEGDVVSLQDASWTFEGDPDTLTLSIDWGDGTEEQGILVSGSGGGRIANSHRYGDNGTYSIRLTMSDHVERAKVDGLQVEVANLPPVIALGLDQEPYAAEGFTLSVPFSDAGWLDTHSATIDWGDGTIEVAPIEESDGRGTIAGQHSFAVGGIYAITVKLADDDGGIDTAQSVAVVTGSGVRDGTLYVIGTNNDDQVTINKQGNGLLKVHANFFPEANFRTYSAAGVQAIVVLLYGGSDQATVAGSITTPVLLDGGSGNDRLNGGGGPNILLGGIGDDELIGGAAADILIGGVGRDRLVGNGGDDILVAGSATVDPDPAEPGQRFDQALLSLVTEWSRSKSMIPSRLHALDDRVEDILTGSAGRDWFFARTQGSARDRILDRKQDELIEELV